MQKAVSVNNVVIVYVKGNAYRIHFCYMSKDDAINIMNSSNLVDKRDNFVFIEVTYFDFVVVEIYVISTHSYTLWREKVKIVLQ